MVKASDSRGWRRWCLHPLVGFIGTLTSLVSVPLAFYLYWKALPSRELVMVEPPVRSVFVNRDAPSVLDVRVAGSSVTQKDVFAVQLAIWNNGNQSIRPENILEPLTLHPMDGTRVIDAKVLRTTREICGIAAKVVGDDAAEVDWKILESGDGAIVQLVLVGDQRCRVGIRGTVEGGGKPRYVHRVRETEKEAPEWSSSKPLRDIGVNILIFVGLAWAALHLLVQETRSVWKQRRESANWRKELAGRIFGGAICLFIAFVMGASLLMDTIGYYRVPGALLVERAAR